MKKLASVSSINFSMKTKDVRYVQCALKRINSHQMAWIPEQFAVVGKFLKIKAENGWEVVGVSDGKSRSAAEANEASQLYKKTRKASDV